MIIILWQVFITQSDIKASYFTTGSCKEGYDEFRFQFHDALISFVSCLWAVNTSVVATAIGHGATLS